MPSQSIWYLSLASTMLAAPALAQTAPDAVEAADKTQDDMIIVTAQKRSQSWLDVPVALSVQSREELEQERSLNLYDMLRQVPGVTGANTSDELTQVSIRGLSTEDYGIGSDPTVGVFFDGAYLGRSENTATNFIDLERVEIARGPQGALFGRATPAGAISLIPVRPGPASEYSAIGEVGTIGHFRGAVVGNVPVSDTLFLRGSAIVDRSGDYVDNLALGEELGAEFSATGRLALRWEAGSYTTVDLTGWVERFEGDPWLYRNFVETVGDGEDAANKLSYSRAFYSDVPEAELKENRTNWGSVLRVTHDFDSGVEFTSITSALGYKSDYLEDFDGSDMFLFNYGQYTKQALYSQELRLVSDGSGPISWFAGALAYHENVNSTIVQSYGDFDLCLFYEFGDETDCAPAGDGVTDTFIYADGSSRGFALYGDVTAKILRNLELTVGARYTGDRKKLVVNAPLPGGFLPADEVGYTTPTDGLDVTREKYFTSFQPRVALNFRPIAGLSVYGLYSEGEKPGGFDTFDAFSPAFNAEKVQTFEAGLKGSFNQGKLTFSLAAYSNDYTDLQVLAADGPRDIVRNAATASGSGVEFETTLRRGIGEIGLRAAVIDSKFNNFQDGAADYSGNRLPYTPKYTIGATLAAEKPIGSGWTVYGHADADYQAHQYLTPANDDFTSMPGYERIDLRLGFRHDNGMDLYLFGKNVTDAHSVGVGDVTDYDANFGAYLAQFSSPAVFGVGFSIKSD